MNQRKLTKILQSYGNISSKGARKFFCGEKLSNGCSREVFVLKQDPNYVVKIEYKDDTFHNIKEWMIWDEVQFCPAIAKWFAPCLVMNASGTVLIQRRVEFGRKCKEYPKRIPRFFTDTKIENYGWLDNQLVCVDYASVYFSILIDIKKKEVAQTKAARWWTVKRLKTK